MLDKFITWLEQKTGWNINEKFFIGAILPIIAWLVFAATSWGQATWGNIIGLFAGVGFNIIIFLASVFGLKYFLMGSQTNIHDEIKNGNIAVAIYMLGIILGLAIVISKGIM